MVASSNSPHLLIDVRPSIEYEICSLPNSLSILDNNNLSLWLYLLDNQMIFHCQHFILMMNQWEWLLVTLVTIWPQVNIVICYGNDYNDEHIYIVYIVCHHGNDSQLAVQRLKQWLPIATTIKDIIGGLSAWSMQVDKSFPQY